MLPDERDKLAVLPKVTMEEAELLIVAVDAHQFGDDLRYALIECLTITLVCTLPLHHEVGGLHELRGPK